jgi:uncharacterized membrane protein YeaQ/YmgE (transglycosylase-associated protein family)
MWLIGAVIVGLIVGAIARLIVPGRHPRGLLVTVVVGVAGSVLATLAGRASGLYDAGQRAGFLASIVGAVVLLLALQALEGGPLRR